MVEKLEKTLIEDEVVSRFNAPIPGESMTNSPANPKSWERPPQHVDEDDVMKELYLLLTDPDKLQPLINLMDGGTPLDEIAQVILYQGYTSGKYNPDLMLLLIEPTLFLLISIADYAEIKDYVLYEGEENDPETNIPDDDVVPVDMDGDGIPDEPKQKTKKEPDESSVSSSLLAKIKTDLPSKVKEAITKNGDV